MPLLPNDERESVAHEGSDLPCVEHQPLQIQDTREELTSEHDQGGDINGAHLILKILAQLRALVPPR
jgi:hypothetical protein